MASVLRVIGSEMAGCFQDPIKAETGTRLAKDVVVDRLYADMEIKEKGNLRLTFKVYGFDFFESGSDPIRLLPVMIGLASR